MQPREPSYMAAVSGARECFTGPLLNTSGSEIQLGQRVGVGCFSPQEWVKHFSEPKNAITTWPKEQSTGKWTVWSSLLYALLPLLCRVGSIRHMHGTGEHFMCKDWTWGAQCSTQEVYGKTWTDDCSPFTSRPHHSTGTRGHHLQCPYL